MHLSKDEEIGLLRYITQIEKWNSKINLVSSSSTLDIWRRHILDCAQLINYISRDDIVYDLGSGAGLPGIVISILGIRKTFLIESDQRKAAFLKTASICSDNEIIILNDRIENIDFKSIPKPNKIVSRALASTEKILEYSDLICHSSCPILLLKGKNFEKELEEAEKNWHFDLSIHKSKTNSDSAILEISNVRKKNENHSNS